MTHFQTLLVGLTVGFEAILCGFVFARKAQRILPFFSAYCTAILATTVSVWLVYEGFGFNSLAAYYCYWILLLVNALVRCLAIAELCRYRLRLYPGIWALVWRLFVGISMLFFIHAAI